MPGGRRAFFLSSYQVPIIKADYRRSGLLCCPTTRHLGRLLLPATKTSSPIGLMLGLDILRISTAPLETQAEWPGTVFKPRQIKLTCRGAGSSPHRAWARQETTPRFLRNLSRIFSKLII